VQRPDATQLVTYKPGLTDPRWLGAVGAVVGLNYSDVMPGGNDTLSCTLQMQPGKDDASIAPGRILRACRGARWVWEGNLTTPAGDPQGWKLTAQGAGHYGDNFVAVDNDGFVNADTCIANAVGRGMRWIDPGVSDTGMFLSQPPNNASSMINDWLNLITSAGAYTWHVGPWNTLEVFPIPTTVTRLLVATTPAARTLHGYINTLWELYDATGDSSSGPGEYQVAESQNAASVAVHGQMEAPWDLSSSGVMSGTDATSAGDAVLSRYIAASYATPFAVSYGQYLTTGGTPVDLGCERAGEVVRLLLADRGYGGQVTPGISVTFPVGKVEYDDDNQVAQITPFQSIRSDMASMLSALAQLLQPATTPTGG
jgi:hypothetical protein